MRLAHVSTPVVESKDVVEVSVVSVLASLFGHRVTIAVSTAACMAAGLCYAYLSAPVYQARLSVQIENTGEAPANNDKSLMGDVSSMFPTKSSAEGEMQLLDSGLVIARAVDALSLDVSATPRYFPVIGRWLARNSDDISKPGLLGMGGYAWGAESIRVERFEVPREMLGQRYSLEALAGGEYRLRGPGLAEPVIGRVGVAEHFETARGPLVLRVGGIVGAPGVEFDLARHSKQQTVDALQRDLQVSEQGTKSGVIAATLQGEDPLLISATLNEIGNQYVKQNQDTRASYAANSLAFLESQLPVVKARVEKAEADYSNYRNQFAIVDIDEAGKLLLKQSADAESNLLALQQKRQELASRFAPTLPEVSYVDRQIDIVRKRLDDLTARIKSMPSSEQGALALMREVHVSTSLYSGLLNNMAELSLLKASRTGSVRVVDLAEPPELPVKPKKSVILLASTGIGLLLGTAIALARTVLISRVTDARTLEGDTGIEVYATVPLSIKQHELGLKTAAGARAGPMLLAVSHPHDPAVESLRMLRTALQIAVAEAHNNVVMLTGPLPGIGKSFVSANLAAVLAAGGQRVLLVDADMRRGHLHRQFGVVPQEGLADVIEGTVRFDEAVHRDIQPNLDFLATGLRPSNPAELLASRRWKEFAALASSRYDVVLLDAPAVLPVSDVGIMASSAGAIFLVVRFGETRSDQITESIRTLTHAGSAVRGMVVNGIVPHGGRRGHPRTYGGYVSYGYETIPHEIAALQQPRKID